MILRLLSLTALALSLSACKVKFDVPKTTVEVESCDGSAACDDGLDVYNQVRYFNGGWYGPYPNYKHDLTLTLKSDKSVEASLVSPDCKIKSSISLKEYRSLIGEVKNSPTEYKDSVQVIDRGDHVISLSENSRETHYFLKLSDNSYGEMILKDTTKVKAAALKIIEKISAADTNCHDPVINVEYFQESSIDFMPQPSDARFILPGSQYALHAIAREFSLDLQDSQLNASAKGTVDSRAKGHQDSLCHQAYKGQVWGKFLEAAKNIKITNTKISASDCFDSANHYGPAGTITLKRKSGKIEKGDVNKSCSTNRVENFQPLNEAVDELLSAQDLNCALIE